VNYIDLFSGIGGFALGAYWAGMKFENHYFSEVEPFAVELYQKRFPDAIPLGDIKEINCEELADATSVRCDSRKTQGQGIRRENNSRDETDTGGGSWIITGGFPCQDISVAGKGEGIRGSRSGLWFEYWRIIRDLRPRYAIMENVGALTFRGLTDVLGSLAEIGYDAEWQDIRAEDVGAPHRRERIWIIAYPNEYSKSSRSEYAKPGQGELVQVAHPQCNGRVERGAECERQRRWATSVSTSGEMAYPRRDSTGSSDQSERASSDATGRDEEMAYPQPWDRGAPELGNPTSERLQDRTEISMGKPGQIAEPQRSNWWAVEPDVGRLAHGIPRRMDRLKGLGNAIVPQIAELLFRQIKGLL